SALAQGRRESASEAPPDPARAGPAQPSPPIEPGREVAWPAWSPGEGAMRTSPAPFGEDVGAWVLEQLRAHRFNLLAAARHLQALRRLGAPRQSVPVFDRGALDYYLCGEFYHRLVASGFQLEETVALL